MKNAGQSPVSASPTGTFSWQLRFLPSLTDLVFIFPILYLLFRMQGVSTLLGDGDTGWHIRTGEWILQNHRVPYADIFSFSKPGQPWFAWEWLWDVCFALIHQAGGLSAVLFVNIALLGAIFVLLFRYIRRECGSDLVSLLITLLALAGTSMHWLARPHLVSWLFILIFRHLLSRASEGRTKLLWWLPVLMIAWTNLHGAFFVGIALVFAYAIDPLVQDLRSTGPNRLRKTLPFLLGGAGCLTASFVNPYTYNLHRHLVSYLLDSKPLENIIEFQSISFHLSVSRYFEFMLAVGAFAAIDGWRRGRYTEVALFVVWAHLGLLAIRNIPIFILLIAPSVGVAFSMLLSRFPRARTAASDFHAIERIPRLHIASVGALCLLFLLMLRPGDAAILRSEYGPADYPDAAVAHLQAMSASRIFSDDEWGGYLIYRMYPSALVFVDGRSDFYGAEFESSYADLMKVRYDWEQSFAKYAIDTVLLRVQASLAGAMKQSPHWKVIYDDRTALIFKRIDATGNEINLPTLSANQKFLAVERGKHL